MVIIKVKISAVVFWRLRWPSFLMIRKSEKGIPLSESICTVDWMEGFKLLTWLR